MIKIYYIFAKDIHILPSELDNMFWYDVVFILKEHQEYIETENENNAKMEQEYNNKYDNYQTPVIPKFEQPKMPDFSNFKI